jgi:hypothetical protein
MDIVAYIKNLANTTPRANVMKQVAELRIAYRESSAPLLEGVKALGNETDLGPDLKTVHAQFRSVKNFGSMIEAIIKVAPKVGELIEDKLTTEFESRFSNTGLTYRQANVLMLIELYAFMHRYSLRYLAHAFDVMDDVAKEDAVSRAEVKRLTEEAFAFVRGFEIMSTPIEKLDRLLSETTEAFVDRDAHAIFSATNGVLKTDPLTLGFVDVKFNPFFLIGRYFADKDIEAYYVAREERESLALRLIRLRERSANQSTDELQNTITEIEDQIRRRQRKIDDMEAKYGN